MNRMLNEFAEDSKALGGIPIFIFSILFAWAVGYPLLAIKMTLGFLLCYVVAIPFRFWMPLKRPEKRPARNIFEKFDQAGFPSLHTMRVFVLTGLLSTVFNSPAMLTLLLAAALIVAASKVIIKHHYIRDIFGGAAIGTVIVCVIQRLIV